MAIDEADERNGVIDEPGEIVVENQAFEVSLASGQIVPVDFQNRPPSYTFDSTIAADGRQLPARHLYVLMMALSRELDPASPLGTASAEMDFPSINGTGGSFVPPGTAANYKARRLAQWAVNVVDYRDPDSIITRFVFDPNPFDGWSPPAITAADSEFVVWGVESPELVFTESVAFHDVRLQDGNQDNGGGTTKTDATPDNDSDQVRVPQGSVFLELYCPRSTIAGDQTTKQGAPQELYTTVAGLPELDLARLAPPVNSGGLGLPVWRVAFSEPHYRRPHPTANTKFASNPALLRETNPDTASPERFHPDEIQPPVTSGTGAGNALDLERFIWFRPFGSLAAIAQTITDNEPMVGDLAMTANEVFFPPTGDIRESVAINADRTLAPGQFLVIRAT